jgi:hypothetical protein
MIVLFSAGGRTGNQLFQVAYLLSKRRKNEWIVTFEFGATRALLSGSCRKRWLNIQPKAVRLFAEKWIYPLVYHGLVKTGIVSSHFDKNYRHVIRTGMIRRITVMKGYFESANEHSGDLLQSFRLRESLRSRVRPLVAGISEGRTPLFIHLRRSDFGDLKQMLPDSYYHAAAQTMQRMCSHAFYVIVGDDPAYAERLFQNIRPKYVSRLSMAEDLALMTLCKGGILSNSTFAWWGACFGQGSVGYVAPKYWTGFAKGAWIPPGIQAGFMTEIIEVPGGHSA